MGMIYNCDQSEIIEKAAEELKKFESIKAPDWAPFVKTGMHKERPPSAKDWWYMRAASILLKVYKLGPIGIPKLRTKYGGKKNKGSRPGHFYKGSGSIIRKVLQQLEKEDLIKKDIKSQRKGRLITAKGKKFLNDVAGKISKVTVSEEKTGAKEKAADNKEVKKEKETKQENKAERKETKEKPVAKPKETA